VQERGTIFQQFEAACYFFSPNSYHIAFSTPNAKAKASPRIQLKYHMRDPFAF